ncbi:MAG: FAD synthetase family protein [Clostridiales bacterium]|nr:FAD synthetase family protein [Clostridiales bacterium]
MRVIDSIGDYTGAPSVVALGMFDGVHIGHQRLIRTAVEVARGTGCQCVVSTFDRHPLAVICPERAPRQLCTLEQNLHKMERLGADWALVQHFDSAFGDMDAEAYLRMLVKGMNARYLVVGENYTFGRGGRGTPGLLRTLEHAIGYETVVVPPVMDGKRVTSSTYIRELLEAGEAEHARRLLDIAPDARK